MSLPKLILDDFSNYRGPGAIFEGERIFGVSTGQSFPKVGVIILSWNDWQDTIECLESLQKIDYPNYEMIVVDNGSTDGLVEKLKRWAKGEIPVDTRFVNFDASLKPVRYVEYDRKTAEAGGDQQQGNLEGLTSSRKLVIIRSGKNLGFPGGNNVGIRYVLEKEVFGYVLLLNNDTAVAPDFLTKMVEVAEQDEETGIVGGKIYYYHHPQRIWYGGGKLSLWRASGFNQQMDETDRELPAKDSHKEPKGVVEATFITGCLILIRKELLQNIGLLREDYFLSLEDTDFCYQALQKGWKLKVNLEAKIWHKVAPTKGGEISLINSYYITRNRLFFGFETIQGLRHRIVFGLFFFLTRPVRLLMWAISDKKSVAKGTILGIRDFFTGKKGQGIL
jgi:hypothetical protein